MDSNPSDPAVRTTARPSAAAPPRLFAGLRTVSLLTLASRMLGLVRDMGMAMLFGNGPLFDAFSVAFRIPNFARRLFGEGALTAAFLPVFVREHEQAGHAAAARLATAMLVLLAVLLGGIVLLGELGLAAMIGLGDPGTETRLLLELTAILLPYLLLICLSAQVAAILHALGHFTWPALVPVILNVVWIVALWGVADRTDDPHIRLYVICAAIVFAGALQLAAPLIVLRRMQFHYDPHWRLAGRRVLEVGRGMLPVIVGLSILQLNTLCDGFLAWGLAAPGTPGESAPWGWTLLPSGTASALYLGQRLYQFPLGVFGIALGTVMFPLLARHAEQGRLDRLRESLALGLRLVLAIGLPASLGLVLLAGPLSTLLFKYGAFDADDASQTAAMVGGYGLGVWAFSAVLIVHRGWYALGDSKTPMHVGMAAVAVNLVLNVALILTVGGQGLALATSLTAMVQLAGVLALLQRKTGPLDWPAITRTLVRALLACGLMAVVCLLCLDLLPVGDHFRHRLLRVGVPIAASCATYFLAAWWLGMDELALLLRRSPRNVRRDDDS